MRSEAFFQYFNRFEKKKISTKKKILKYVKTVEILTNYLICSKRVFRTLTNTKERILTLKKA